MYTPRHDTLRLRLIFIFILLIGFSINSCGDSEDDEALPEPDFYEILKEMIEDKKVDASVLAAVQTQSTISVAIYLQDKPPSKQISDEVKAQFQPNIEAKATEIRDKIRPFHRRNQPLPPNVKAEVRVMHESLDTLTRQMRQEIGRRLKDYVSASQQRVRQAIEKAGGTVYAQVALGNIIGAQLPATAVNQIAGLNDVRWIELDPEVVPAAVEPTENHGTKEMLQDK